MKAHIRPVHEGDLDSIILLLRGGHDSRLSYDAWRRLFDYPRAVKNQPNMGFVLESRAHTVGFLGAIYSERLVGEHVERFCNLSSWYVHPEFRSYSIALLMAVLKQPGYTFTDLSSNQAYIPVKSRCGFRQLESYKLLCGPWLYRSLLERKMRLPRSGSFYKARRILEIVLETSLLKGTELMRESLPTRLDHRGVQLLAGAELVRPMLSKTDQQLLDDHRQCGHFLVQGEQSYSYVVTVNRKIRFERPSLVDFIVSDILHLSSRELALQHWQPLCQLIAGHERSRAVMADERLFGGQCPDGVRLPSNSYFLSRNGVSPNQIDSLYTEVALLDLLFYV
jgi:hypothetical protein